MIRPEAYFKSSRSQLAGLAMLISLVAPAFVRAGVAIGPTYTNATIAEQHRQAQFFQAEQSFQEKLKVGRERFQKRQAERAKTIAAMTSELETRRESVAVQPLQPPNVNPKVHVGWLPSLISVAAVFAGAVGFVGFLNRPHLQEVLVQDLEPLEPEPPVVIIPIAEQVFSCESDFASARGMHKEQGFLVLKGSVGHLESLIELINSGVAREEAGYAIFQEDHLFRSPSIAATLLMGKQANGWVEWKNKNGETLDTVARHQPTE